MGRYPPVRVFTYVNDSTRKEPQLENVGTPDPFPEFWKGIEETLKKVWNKRDELGSNYPKHAADRGGLDKGYSGDRQWFWKTRTKNVNDLIHELGYRETKPENVDEFIHSEERKEALATLKENIPFTTFVRLRSVFSTIDFTKTDFKEDDPLIQKMLRYNPKLLIDKAAILKEEIKKSKKEEIEPLQKSLDSLIKKIQSEQTQRMRIILRRQFESFEDYLGGKTSIEQAYENVENCKNCDSAELNRKKQELWIAQIENSDDTVVIKKWPEMTRIIDQVEKILKEQAINQKLMERFHSLADNAVVLSQVNEPEDLRDLAKDLLLQKTRAKHPVWMSPLDIVHDLETNKDNNNVVKSWTKTHTEFNPNTTIISLIRMKDALKKFSDKIIEGPLNSWHKTFAFHKNKGTIEYALLVPDGSKVDLSENGSTIGRLAL